MMATVSDYGTNELHRHHETKPELTGRGHAVRMRVQDAVELDRLLLKGVINPLQHSAGESLARDLHRARLIGLATVNFAGSTGGGGSITDAQADAFGRVSDAVRYLDNAVGTQARQLVVNLCLSVVKLRTHHEVLDARAGLDALLSHYDPKAKHQLTSSLAG